mmetsp:Transcript_37670/g.82384  ORF Transcript_37670/g.82384 Transcript_37670/m.82384 type:complete len:417 (-) Transcript_37670:48-1298(-)
MMLGSMLRFWVSCLAAQTVAVQVGDSLAEPPALVSAEVSLAQLHTERAADKQRLMLLEARVHELESRQGSSGFLAQSHEESDSVVIQQRMQQLETENAELRQVNAQLLSANGEQGSSAVDTIKQLRAAVVAQHQYGVKCHAKIGELHQKLKTAVSQFQVQDSANQVAAQQLLATSRAAAARLETENMHLRNQIATIQGIVDKMIAKVKSLEAAYNTAVATGAHEAADLKQKLRKAKALIAGLKGQVTRVSTKEKTATMKSELCEKKIADMNIEALRKQLANVQRSLAEQTVMLGKAEEDKAKAQNEASVANANMAASKQMGKINALAAKKTADDAQKSVVDVLQKLAKETERADKLKLEAERAMQANCGKLWNDRNKKVREALVQCKLQQASFETVQASAKTLKTALEQCNSRQSS